MYLSERITADNITIDYHLIGQTATHYQWAVTLHRPDGHTFRLPDPFESNDEPTAFDVLDLITSHCSIIDQATSFRDWQGEYMIAEPYTPEWDERNKIYTEAMFNSWYEINDRLRDFLGHQGHEDYLYETDRSR